MDNHYTFFVVAIAGLSFCSESWVPVLALVATKVMMMFLNAEAVPFRPGAAVASQRQQRQQQLQNQEQQYFSRQQQSDDKTFPQFSELTEEIMMHILSFVAEAPLERTPTNICISTLTHGLPLVSKQMRQLALHDSFWKDALLRQTIKEPYLWHTGLLSLLPPDQRVQQREQNVPPKQLVEQLHNEGRAGSSSYKDLYRTVLNTSIRFQGPIFYMQTYIKLGEPYGLHFFEPRYRRLIAEVMQPYPESFRRGEPIELEEGQSPPIFIHAHQYLSLDTPACLVQVLRCGINPNDGRADVYLLPIAYVRMERIWSPPNSGRLYYAQCLRLGHRTTWELDTASQRRGPNPLLLAGDW